MTSAIAAAPFYPIRFEHFPDGLYVVAATADNRDALGAR